jgi:hypothetical protein
VAIHDRHGLSPRNRDIPVAVLAPGNPEPIAGIGEDPWISSDRFEKK